MPDLVTSIKTSLTGLLGTLESYSVPELAYEAINGKPSPVYNSLQDLQLKQAIAGAGGGAAAQSAAVDAVNADRSLWTSQDPLTTLKNTLLYGSPGGGSSGGSYDYLSLALTVAFIALAFYASTRIIKAVI